MQEGVLLDPATQQVEIITPGSEEHRLTVRKEGPTRTFSVISEVDAERYYVIAGTPAGGVAETIPRGTTMHFVRSRPSGKERRTRLVAKYRAKRDQRRDTQQAPIETIDQFTERVFGSEAARDVLVAYLKEHADWTPSGDDDSARPPHGR